MQTDDTAGTAPDTTVSSTVADAPAVTSTASAASDPAPAPQPEPQPEPQPQPEPEPEPAPRELPPLPTVGRIVHFYTKNPDHHTNGIGEGPYPAMVIQVFQGGEGYETMANLEVHAWGHRHYQGSVLHQSQAGGHGHYWVWPPKV